jgi:hypothetical protein
MAGVAEEPNGQNELKCPIFSAHPEFKAGALKAGVYLLCSSDRPFVSVPHIVALFCVSLKERQSKYHRNPFPRHWGVGGEHGRASSLSRFRTPVLESKE